MTTEPQAPDLLVRSRRSTNPGEVTYAVLHDPPPDWARRQFNGLEPQAVPLLPGDADKMRLEDIVKLDAGLGAEFNLVQIVKIWRVVYK